MTRAIALFPRAPATVDLISITDFGEENLERDNLWLRRAYSRRRVLGGIGAGAAGLAIVGCTSTTETPTAAPASTARPASSAVAAPTTGAAQPTKQPKYGGTFKVTQGSADQANLDPHL